MDHDTFSNMKTISFNEAYERVAEYFYNMDSIDQIGVLRENFGVDITAKADGSGVIYEGEVLTWEWFDGYVSDFIDSLEPESVAALYSDIHNEEWEYDRSKKELFCEVDEDEQLRRDEKHGLYGGKVDVAN